jgi:hypothetical protein
VTFIFKAVAILFLFAFVVYVLKAITRLSSNVRKTAKDLTKMRDQIAMRQPGSTEMIRCAACGAFVSPRDAVQVSSGGRAQRFCSYECVQTHAKTA